MKSVLSSIFKYAFISSAFTILLMVLIWGRVIPMIWDPKADIANFGIPMILYDPKISFKLVNTDDNPLSILTAHEYHFYRIHNFDEDGNLTNIKS